MKLDYAPMPIHNCNMVGVGEKPYSPTSKYPSCFEAKIDCTNCPHYSKCKNAK